MKPPLKDHFPLPFMDQMLERLAGRETIDYCFFLGFFQIPIDPKDKGKEQIQSVLTEIVLAYIACLSAYAMHQARSRGVCWLSFMTWSKRRWKSLWTTFRSLEILSKNCYSRLRQDGFKGAIDTNLLSKLGENSFHGKEGIVLGTRFQRTGLI
ncbi:hypothetical protein Tco_1427384 [Tanacetum coccineum]